MWNDNDRQLTNSAPAYTFSHAVPLDDPLLLLGEESSHQPGHTHEAEERHFSDFRHVAITAIRATGMTLGLRWIPASFYLIVQAEGAQWQTTSNPVHVDIDVVSWNEQIVLPSDISCKVRFKIYVSFELGPMFGHGDLLRAFDISVAELLDCSENSRSIVFQPKVGAVVSPCTSLFITVEKPYSCETNVRVPCPISIFTPSDMRDLMLMADSGHLNLGRYYRTQDIRDLDQAIESFERARGLCPDNHPCHPAALFNLARAKFIRCQVKGSYLDLDISISHFQYALDLRPTGHPDRPTTQLHLAIALLSRFTKYGCQTDADAAEEVLNEVLDICHAKSHIYRLTLLAINTHVLQTDANDRPVEGSMAQVLPWSVNALADRLEQCMQSNDPHALDEGISLHYEALKYYSTAHARRWQLLSNLGAALQLRFHCQGIAHDLEEAITFFGEALHLRPVGHPYRPLSLSNLANALNSRFKSQGNDKDLEEAIAFNGEALHLLAVGHPLRFSLLSNFASMLSTRFKHQGNNSLKDLEDAIAFYREALLLRPIGHSDRSSSLITLANALSTYFGHQGNDKDLGEAITFFGEALHLHPVGHPDRSSSLNYLANALYTRFKCEGNDKDLGEAIAYFGEVLDLHPVGHPHRPSSLNNLAITLAIRFDHQGNDKDLDEAISFFGEALHLYPVDHPDRSLSLNNIANALSDRFQHQGNDKDLEEAITFHREALRLHPVNHMNRSLSLYNLANTLSIRFKHQGNDKDLEEAIAFHRESLHLRPVGHPDLYSSLNNLATALSTRFKHQGNDKDLEEAIAFHEEALHLHPIGHPKRCSSLNKLANALSTRFEHKGNDKDIEKAITFYGEALHLQPVGHPDRSSSLDNLATAFSTRFKHQGNDKDLDEAIALHWKALDLHPVSQTGRYKLSNNLATALYTRFEHQGNEKDLAEAIAFFREVLDLHPVGHTDRYKSSNNLATILSTRFEHQRNDKDLEEAIALHVEALHSLPIRHTERSLSLNNLAITLSIRFEYKSNDKDLEEAIAFHREALHLRPVGHPDRSSSLNNLATALSTRFEHQGGDKDLDEAIAFFADALHLHPVGHPGRFPSLSNLAKALLIRFKHRGNFEDVHEALANARSALSVFALNHPGQSLVHRSLSDIYLLFHESGLHSTGEDVNSLNVAIDHLKAAAELISSGLLSRLRASLHWVSRAQQYTHSMLLEAYAVSIQLLDVYMSATASVSSRHHTMKLFPRTLAVDAACCALQSGDVCRAVELLEQGRTLIWTQMARFRVPLDNAQECGDDAEALVKKFRELSSLLDKPPAELPEGTPRVKVEAEATRYTHLVDEWSKVVEEIRRLEGFSRFLLPPVFSDLQDAARDGPIIVLIASELSCDAIIIPHEYSPVHIRLVTSFEKLVLLVNALQRTVKRVASPEDKRAKLVEALRELWVDVVSPVVENLVRYARPGSRIWWCPTSVFNFLPLHAAGEYRQGGTNLSRIYISSYTPSLTALIRARRSHDRSKPVPFAAIGQNLPAGFRFPLASVEPELELVQNLLLPVSTVSFTTVTSAESTKSVALRTLRDNHWVHLSCHGKQNFDEPFKSAFLMRDQPLSLLDIMQTDLSWHEFAFLSACETAVGTVQTPDEVIHLAAGLQFAGVRSVIGTFWNVNDSTVRHLVEAFYKNFCGDGKMNSKRAARSLHKAVQSLANNRDIPLDQRIVFMHIGI